MSEINRRDFIHILAAGSAGLTFPNFQGVFAQSTSSNADWMSKLPSSLPLTALSLPGTHDSCAYSSNLGVLAKTQDWNLATQLEKGIRFLDIRCKLEGNKLNLYHGPAYLNMTFDEVLKDCTKFLHDHPKETIVMSLKNEAGSKTPPTSDFENAVSRYGSMLYPNSNKKYSDYWYKLQNSKMPNLGDIRQKIVLVKRFYRNSSIPGIEIPRGAWKDNGFSEFQLLPGHKGYIQDIYENVSVNDKFGSVRQLLNHAVFNGNFTSFYLNFCSASIGILHHPGLNPKKVANFVNPTLEKYFHNFMQFRANGITIMDFPTDTLINHIINLNLHRMTYSVDNALGQSGLLNQVVQIQPFNAIARWEVEDSGKKPGNSIQLWHTKKPTTKWKIYQNHDKLIKLHNQHANLYAGTHNSKSGNGTKCVLVNSQEESSNYYVLPLIALNPQVLSFFTSWGSLNHQCMPIERENGNTGNSTKIQIWNSGTNRTIWDVRRWSS